MLELALNGQVLLWLVVIGVFVASGQATIFHPLTIYLAFHGIVFVLRPFLVHYLGFDTIFNYMLISPSDEEFIKALAITSAGLVAFSGACLFTGRTKTRFRTPAPAPLTPVQKLSLIITTALLSPLVAYSIYSGLSGAVSGEMRGGVYVMTGANGYTVEAQYMIGPIICLWLAATRFNVASLILLVLYMAYRSYNGWSRWTILLTFLVISLVYAWQKRRRWLPIWSLVLVVPLLMLFITLGRNRDYFQQWLDTGKKPEQNEASALSPQEALKRKYDTQEFANFDYVCFVAAVVPNRTGTFTYWAQYLQLFTEPIPRAIWTGKPVGAPVWLFNLNEYGNFLGLTVSLVGDAWMSAGWIGIAVTLSLVGGFLGALHRWFWKHADNSMAALAYLTFLGMLPQWYRDGGISIAKFAFWNLSPLLLWAGLSWVLGGHRTTAVSMLLPQSTKLRLVFSSHGHPVVEAGSENN